MNTLLSEHGVESSPLNAVTRLQEYVEALVERKSRIVLLEEFEREVHHLVMEVERELVAEGLSRFDIDTPVVELDGVAYRRVYRGKKRYLSAAGEIEVERSLYRRGAGVEALCPLELQAGIVAGYWSPLAARQGVWVTAQLPPAEGEALFREMGNMTPSTSSLDRLTRQLGEQWERHREGFETSLCAEIVIPEQAVSVSASLDGVMVPMRRSVSSPAVSSCDEGSDHEALADAPSEAVKAHQQPHSSDEQKPCYKEASCATLSFYDAAGERLETLRFARMPESGKPVLKSQLREAVTTILGQRPELRLVKLADGAKDNWRFLSDQLCPGEGVELLDFFHASEHLNDALEAAYGKGSSQAKAQHEKYRLLLRDEDQGVEKVIRALAYLKKKHPRREKLAKELKYFRNNRHRMHYATVRAAKLPIGSGVTEAACKTLVTQRLKCSGMRWTIKGGQGVLTIRGLIQSNRFEGGWQRLANTYKKTVSMPKNVVLLHDKNR